VLATERYDGPEPVNLGAGFKISFRELAEGVAELARFWGRIVWDTSKANGQPRRCLDVSRAQRVFGFRVRRTFREGLARTVGSSLSQSLRSLTIDGMAVIQTIREEVGRD
jgi:GDP-L-fucose synthase